MSPQLEARLHGDAALDRVRELVCGDDPFDPVRDHAAFTRCLVDSAVYHRRERKQAAGRSS